jgi:hypothetical protein
MSKARDLADSVAAGSVLADGVVSLSEVGGGTNNGVVFVNGGGTTTSGSALTYNGTSFGVGSSSYGDAGSISLSVGVAGTTTGGLQLWSTTTGSHTIQWGDGTSGSDTYRGAIEYAHSGDTMRFYTNGSEVMRLTSTSLYTASGINVGIGTSDPAAPLEVAKNQNAATSIKITNTDSTSNNNSRTTLQLADSGGIKASFTYINAGSAVGTYIGSGGGGNLHLTSGAGVTTATLDSSGNLGLGVTPSAWDASWKALQIGNASFVGSSTVGFATANAFFSGGYKYVSSGPAQVLEINNANEFRFLTAPSGDAGDPIPFIQAMTLDASGNLLVGSTSQSGTANRAAVFSANKFGLSVIDTTAQTTGVGGALNLGGNYRSTGDAQAFCRVAAAKENSTDNNFAYAMTFATTPNGGTFTERARIDSSGNLLVGVAGTNNGRLDINTGSGTYIIDAINATGGRYFAVDKSAPVNAFTLDSSGNLLVGYLSGNSKLSVNGAGWLSGGVYPSSIGADNSRIFDSTSGTTGTVTLYIGNAAITTSSDVRLKENIVNTQRNATEIIQQLRVVDHTWNDPSDTSVNNRNSRGVWMGLIAQEAQPIIPWLVNKPLADEDEKGNPQYWHMDYGYAVPLLVKAIQEQQAIIESLTARVSALEEN